MKSWFQARGYPKHLVQKEMSKVRFNKENSNTKESKSKREISCFAENFSKLG